ncbi:MAG TPA: hypothetical protein VE197_22345, partial [Mycobacterium sp.]|nr:hypothetical protein [Mycobacterium sp.]
MNPNTSRVFKVGDFIVFNDEAQDMPNPGRRSYECAQIVGPGSEGDVVATDQFLIQRQYTDETRAGYATFETLRCAHKAGIRFYKLDSKEFTFAAKAGAFRNPSVPPRVECTLPSACVVAAVLGVANHFGYSPWRTFGLAHHTEPFTPGMRTCAGGAYTFQVPGAQAVSSMPVIPMRVHDAASIRCMFGYVQKGTIDGSTSYIVKRTKDGGATWETLELMLIGQTNPAYKTTYDSLVLDGYGTPDTRRLPYKDFGNFLWDAVVASASPQTVQTGAFGAIKEGPAAGEFVHVGLGTANEEYVQVAAVDWANQTFTAVFTKNHNAGERVRPTVWPTP